MKPTPIENLEAGGITFYKGSAGGDVIKRAAELSNTKAAVNTAVFFVLVSTLYFSQPAYGLDSVHNHKEDHNNKPWTDISVANDEVMDEPEVSRPKRLMRQGGH